MELLHAITRAKAGAAEDALLSAEERDSAQALAGSIGWPALHRLWQLLLKGLQDVAIAPDPHEAAAMALLRLIHAADLPDPATLLASLAGGGAIPAAARGAPAVSSSSPTSSLPTDFATFVDAVEAQGRALLAVQLRDHVGLVSFAAGELVLKPLRPLGPDFARDLAAAAKQATDRNWEIRLTDEGGEPSLHQQEAMAEERARAAILDEPSVRALLDAFPDATLETVTRKEA